MAAKPFASGHLLAAADVNDLTGIYDRNHTVVDVVSTTAETSIYSKSIGAGHMSTDRMLRLTIGGTILQNATALATLRIKLGGVTLWDAGAISVGSNDADLRPWNLQLCLFNLASATTQRLIGNFFLGDPSLGTAGFGTQYAQVLPLGANGTVNTAIAATLDVTVQWNTSSANASWRKLPGILELL